MIRYQRVNNYDFCPRGPGTIGWANHRRARLRHVIYKGQLYCMAEEAVVQLDQQHLAECKAADERCKGA